MVLHTYAYSIIIYIHCSVVRADRSVCISIYVYICINERLWYRGKINYSSIYYTYIYTGVSNVPKEECPKTVGKQFQ